MELNIIFLVLAFLCGLLGTLVILLSSRAYSKYIELSLQMHELMIHQLIENSLEQVSFQNADEFRENGAKTAKLWFIAGLLLVIGSFLLHLYRVLCLGA